LTEPLAYIEFMSLVVDCALAITDSGGIQEETSYLGIPCLTLRENTERPITITAGTNRLITPAALEQEATAALARGRQATKIPLWDGHAARRSAESLRRRLS